MTYTIEITYEIGGDTENQRIIRAHAIRRILAEVKLPSHASLITSAVYRDEGEE